jgi:NADH-quinone oxidoreductase subunit G
MKQATMSDTTSAEVGPGNSGQNVQAVSIGASRRFEGRVVEITDPISITVDGVAVTAQAGELLIDACERAGAYIPRFCYHPRMSPVGMCRMCLVEVDGPRGPSLQPSCMVPVGADMVVNTDKPNIAKAQDGVLEFLLANHPLDCPVCDKGGECPLQDQTVAYGPGESRFVEEKRHYEKPISISETVYLDRERCILCDRCTRFADEVAGDPLIHFTERGSNTQVLTFPDEPFASYFSGNVVQICPVGALTAKPYRFKARPWDLQSAESTCTDCSVGCRVSVDTSRNKILRLNGVDSDPINQGWLCDRGRFGFEAVNSPHRLSEPLVRQAAGLQPASWADALDHAAAVIHGAVNGSGGGSVALLGGAALSDQAAYAWAQLADAIGTDRRNTSFGRDLGSDVYGLPQATIDEACAPGGTVLWIGPDPKEELPVLFLRLRDAVRTKGVRLLHLASPEHGSLTDLAALTVAPRVGELGRALAGAIAGSTSDEPTPGLDALVQALREAGPLTVVAGRRTLSEGVETSREALAAIRSLRPDARYLIADPAANARGALLAGLHGADLDEIIDGIGNGSIAAVIVLNADPLGEGMCTGDLASALAKVKVISVGTLVPDQNLELEVALPMAAWGETTGSTTNLEGRVLGLSQRVTPIGTCRDAALIAADIADRLGHDLGFDTVDELTDLMAERVAARSGLTAFVLGSNRGRDGLLAPAEDAHGSDVLSAVQSAPLPKVSGYSFRLVAVKRLYSDTPRLRACASSAPLIAASTAWVHPADFATLGLAEGASVSLISPRGTAAVQLRPSPAVDKGNLHAVIDGSGSGLSALIDPAQPLTEVRIKEGGA